MNEFHDKEKVLEMLELITDNLKSLGDKVVGNCDVNETIESIVPKEAKELIDRILCKVDRMSERKKGLCENAEFVKKSKFLHGISKPGQILMMKSRVKRLSVQQW